MEADKAIVYITKHSFMSLSVSFLYNEPVCLATKKLKKPLAVSLCIVFNYEYLHNSSKSCVFFKLDF